MTPRAVHHHRFAGLSVAATEAMTFVTARLARVARSSTGGYVGTLASTATVSMRGDSAKIPMISVYAYSGIWMGVKA
jgi:hypothetical protein